MYESQLLFTSHSQAQNTIELLNKSNQIYKLPCGPSMIEVSDGFPDVPGSIIDGPHGMFSVVILSIHGN